MTKSEQEKIECLAQDIASIENEVYEKTQRPIVDVNLLRIVEKNREIRRRLKNLSKRENVKKHIPRKTHFECQGSDVQVNENKIVPIVVKIHPRLLQKINTEMESKKMWFSTEDFIRFSILTYFIRMRELQQVYRK